MIDRSHGSPALQKFFFEVFEGTRITDFWSPYDAVVCADNQKCWRHLLCDATAVSEKHSENPEWKSYPRRLVGMYRDAKKLLSKRTQLAVHEYDMAVANLTDRLANLGSEPWGDTDATRLANRLVKYGNELLPFLWHADVPSDNNAGERAIRPAMIRKNTYCSHSDHGALTQSILMTVFRTLRLRGHQPLATVLNALKTYDAKTGKMPATPQAAGKLQKSLQVTKSAQKTFVTKPSQIEGSTNRPMWSQKIF